MIANDDVVSVLKTIIDPEIYIDIYTLGLIYDIKLEGEKLFIKMTFTSVACPAGPQLVDEIKRRMKEDLNIESTEVEVVFQPPWQPSEELKAMMGLI